MTIACCLKNTPNYHHGLEWIETQLINHQTQIENWFRHAWKEAHIPFYSSVDIRNAGFKIAPVDTNLFPAGFNNLNADLISLSIQAMQVAMERACPDAQGLVLIPENHTRNQFYLQSLAALTDIIHKAGYDVKLGTLREDIKAPTHLELASGQELVFHPLIRKDNKIYVEDWAPCVILLNNDLSSGRPSILEHIEQQVIPPLSLGWSDRLKSQHFIKYKEIAEEFAKAFQIDPWLINPLSRNCDEIDFMKRDGEDCLKQNVSELLADIKAKYREYDINETPFVFIKADAGTYGLGIMVVKSPDDVTGLNRKQRTKMATAKEGSQVSGVLLQEGVPTCEVWGEEKSTAEPVVYMIDHHVVGGFYRVHKEKRADENLNSPGMQFYPIPFSSSCIMPDEQKAPDADPNRFYAYGVIGRLATLAAGREIQQYLTQLKLKGAA